MTDAALPLSHSERSRALNRTLAASAIWLGAFLSGFVIDEPAPYELFMAGLIGIWVLLGLAIPRSAMLPLALLALFNIGGVVAMTQMENWGGAPLYLAVSAFLALTAVFFASVIAADPNRLRHIFRGYTAAAVLTGLAGIAGYAGIGGDLFTLYGRAKGAFQDPNVFAPYLILPALYCLHGVLTRPFSRAVPAMLGLLVLVLAIFLSFSRAGWGMLAVCALMLAASLMLMNTSGRFRLRIVLLTLFAVAAAIILLVVALQFEAVRNLFLQRAQLFQSYDSARLGRFARQWLGLKEALVTPLGIGPMEFSKIYGEDTHNIWLKSLFAYSWLGFAAYVTLTLTTLAAGFRILFRDRSWQPFLTCAYIALLGHVMIGNVIDTDHWRHFYILLGIVWGCVALEARYQATDGRLRAAT